MSEPPQDNVKASIISSTLPANEEAGASTSKSPSSFKSTKSSEIRKTIKKSSSIRKAAAAALHFAEQFLLSSNKPVDRKKQLLLS